MALAVERPSIEQTSTAGDRVFDACRQAAHLSHEVRLLKSVTKDAIEDGVHATRRAIKFARRRVEELGDLKDETIRRVKRQPLQALGAVFAVGLVLGVAVGRIACRPGREE